MTYLFFIQGEGRGHLTQALTLKEKLEGRGHRVLAAVIGASPATKLPAFFIEQIGIPLINIASPGFVLDKEGRGIRVMASVTTAIRNLPRYWRSIQKIRMVVKEYQPDALVSFYEPMVGHYYRLWRDKRPLFCLGNQYFIASPAYQLPNGHIAQQALRLYNRLSTPRRAVRIALSFTRAADDPNRNFFVCPPLIRTEIKKQETSDGDFILIYLLNAGYSRDIISWSQKHPEARIEAFWNNPSQDITRFGDNLTFHHLSGTKFINRLAHCRAYAATAGFDSIAEAAYLQKEILVVPTKHHFEQRCNAVDSSRIGLAATAASFDLSLIAGRPVGHSSSGLTVFRAWVDDNDDKIAELLEGKRR